MPHNTYGDLPLEGLYELLTSATKEMLAALESNEDNGVAFKAKKRQVELLLAEIDRKIALKTTKVNMPFRTK